MRRNGAVHVGDKVRFKEPMVEGAIRWDMPRVTEGVVTRLGQGLVGPVVKVDLEGLQLFFDI